MARHFRLDPLFWALVLFIANPALAQQTCTPPGALDQSIPAGELATLRIETGTGLLKVEGLTEAEEIRISGRACADEPSVVESIGYNTEIDEIRRLQSPIAFPKVPITRRQISLAWTFKSSCRLQCTSKS